MCSSIKNNKTSILQKGFSILEIAIVTALVGLVVTPAVSIYHQHRVEKDWDEVTYEVYELSSEIGGYRAVFGRYPCPASSTAIPGDLDYGHEFATDCVASAPAPGSCVGGICTNLNTVSGELVVKGSLPYKALNMLEQESYNSNKSRYTYAVTLDLTNNVTFDLNGGGISIVDKIDPTFSLVSPPGTAHFVVLSHGKNLAGAVSRNGAVGIPCTTGSLAEQENCDPDATFVSGDYDSNSFDDRLTFFSPVVPSEWQISQDDLLSIHMKNTDSIAIGASLATDLSSADQTTVLSIGAGSGSAKSTTKFLSEKLCEYNTISPADCFEPELIAGTLVSGALRLEAETNNEGMSCYKPSIGEDFYMTGIANGNILCDDEIFMTCPSGSYLQGIDSDGDVECSNGLPQPRCNDKNITTVCGEPATLTETFSGDRQSVYSGECRNFKPAHDKNDTWFASKLSTFSSLAQVDTMIANLNSKNRDIDDCGTDYTDSNTQTRDSYQCNSSSWDHLKSHGKGNFYNNFPSNLNQAVSWWSTYAVRNTQPSVTDSPNSNYYHGCWCREDFRSYTIPCDTGLSGSRVVIQKHPCPQTRHAWQTIYVSDAEFCECAPNTDIEYLKCNDYYDEIKPATGTNGLSNNWVRKTFGITCPSGPTGPSERSVTPIAVDMPWGPCSCLTNTQQVSKTSCPAHFTNSWIWPGNGSTQNDIESLRTRDYTCPSTTTADGYGNNIPDPGAWGALTPYSPIPACACIDKDPGIERKDCPAGQQGTGIFYKKEWDCTLNGGLGDWEPEADWDFDHNDCYGCTWQTPPGAPDTTESFPPGESKGDTCTCGEDPAPICSDFIGTGQFGVWNQCPCVVQGGP